MLVLSRTLFGAELPLRDFPVLKSVRGLGIADSDVYAERLARLFTLSPGTQVRSSPARTR